MRTGRLSSLIKKLADRETLSGNAIKLSKTTGLSKHFFYSLRDAENRQMKVDSAEKILESVDHPLIGDIERYLDELEAEDKAA